MLSREALEREQRRAAAGRALVLEPAPQQLHLLPVAKLRDRAVGDGAFAVVTRTGGVLDLLVEPAAQVRQLALLALLGERVRFHRGFGERQAPARECAGGPTYRADGRISLPVRCCSRMCADQPATRAQPNMAGYIGGGMFATSRTTAAQNSTFVASGLSGCASRSASIAARSRFSATSTRGEPSSRAVRRNTRARGSSAR